MTEGFLEDRFLRQVEKAVTKAKNVLDINKHPQLPGDIPRKRHLVYRTVSFLEKNRLRG
jgi:hypothetical protein